MKYLLILLALFIVLPSCQNAPSEATDQAAEQIDLGKEMPGVWESVSIHVQINSAENQDTSYTFEVKEENWEQVLGMKPIKTYYELDNKYRTEYYSRFDSLTNVKRGMWNTFGDTLMLIEPDVTYQYSVEILGNGLAQFTSTLASKQ